MDEILLDYTPFTQRFLKSVKSILESVPREIGNRKIHTHYYGTEYGFFNRWHGQFYKRYKGVHQIRFCQIGYRIVTTNKNFGFESEHVDMFYINFCLLKDNYVFIVQTYVPGELRRTCIKPSEPIISNKFTNEIF
ncbi:hypothetical protein EBU94_05745 [bacterium]|nr:hypothetical protein [bacterium]